MEAKKYIDTVFEKLRLLHESAKTKLWLVMDQQQHIYVLKEIARTGLPYGQLAELSPAGLPRLRYVCEQQGFTYVVEEYLQGRSLDQVLAEDGHLPEGQVKYMALELCRCLAFLHGHHIIHRDIKPSNLFLTENQQLKLLDFDAARICKDNQQADTVCLGTKGFAAPEQYGCQPTDGRSDIYSLGVTLRVLLGEGYEGALSSILDRCTEFDAKRRFQRVEDLAAALQAAGEEAALPAGRTAPERTRAPRLETPVPVSLPGRLSICYHVYHSRWFFLLLGLVLQGFAAADWQGWRTPGAVLLHGVLAAGISGIYLWRQHRGLSRYLQVSGSVPEPKTIRLWRKGVWAVGYYCLWFFASVALVGGLGISYSQPWEKTICWLAAIAAPPCLTYMTLQWKLRN